MNELNINPGLLRDIINKKSIPEQISVESLDMFENISDEKKEDEMESRECFPIKSIKNKLINYSMQTNNNFKVLKKARRLNQRPVALMSEIRD